MDQARVRGQQSLGRTPLSNGLRPLLLNRHRGKPLPGHGERSVRKNKHRHVADVTTNVQEGAWPGSKGGGGRERRTTHAVVACRIAQGARRPRHSFKDRRAGVCSVSYIQRGANVLLRDHLQTGDHPSARTSRNAQTRRWPDFMPYARRGPARILGFRVDGLLAAPPFHRPLPIAV